MARTTVSIHFSAAVVPATEIIFTPAAPEFSVPTPAGTLIGSFEIKPDNWTGDVVISGPDAALFVADTQKNVRLALDVLAAKDVEFDLEALP